MINLLVCVQGRLCMAYTSRDIDDLSWVKRGKQRRELIEHIRDDVMTPSELAKKSHYSLNHASKVLNDLAKKGLAECLNKKEKTGRLYRLTAQGKKIRDKLIKMK